MTAPAVEWVNAGISRAAADGRYVRRLVGATLAADTRLQTRSDLSTEPVLAAENGAVQGLWPADASPIFSVIGDSFRGTTRIRTARLATAGGGGFFGAGFRGTIQAPTQVQVGDTLASFGANGTTDVSTLGAGGTMIFQAREPFTNTARGSETSLNCVALGTTVEQSGITIRADLANVLELRLNGSTTNTIRGQSTTRLRNPANTVNRLEWDNTGLGFFGVAPIARPTVTGSRAANAALASLCTQLAALGLIIDSTT